MIFVLKQIDGRVIFLKEKTWEIEMEKNLDQELKYARMYGGDFKRYKRKIPYLKNQV